MVTSENKPASITPIRRNRSLAIAFIVGALVHAVLLASSLLGHSDFIVLLLLVFALPGAIVDMSAEMIHPSQTGSLMLGFVATVVNGGAYALGALVVSKVRHRLRQSRRRL